MLTGNCPFIHLLHFVPPASNDMAGMPQPVLHASRGCPGGPWPGPRSMHAHVLICIWSCTFAYARTPARTQPPTLTHCMQALGQCGQRPGAGHSQQHRSLPQPQRLPRGQQQWCRRRCSISTASRGCGCGGCAWRRDAQRQQQARRLAFWQWQRAVPNVWWWRVTQCRQERGYALPPSWRLLNPDP